MKDILNTLNINILFGILGVFIVIIIIFLIYLIARLSKLEKKLSCFTGENSIFLEKFQHNINNYAERVSALELKYSDLIKLQKEIMDRQNATFQKMGVVRYNPFGDMGGNLSFSVAILDNDDNGIVITGIHSRTGSFTYAKPIVMGVSQYVLSDEELQSIELAKENARKPLTEDELNVLFERPAFERKIKVYRVKQNIRRISEEDLFFNDIKIAEFCGPEKEIITNEITDTIEDNEDKSIASE